MESAKTLVINIVTWNSKRYLPNLFASLDQQTSRDFTVTVVDNVSTDGTLEWLTDTRPDVALLRNFRNQGFARAHNQAIALACSRWDTADVAHRYVMVANPDMEFAPDAVERLIHFMDMHPEAAVCGPKLLRTRTVAEGEDGNPETERTNMIDAMGIAMTKARRPVDRGAGEEDTGQYDGSLAVFGLSGACVVFRVSALKEATLVGEVFDEDFFAYQEDADLMWRMRLLGMQAYVVPEAVVWHHRRAPSLPHGGWLAAWRSRSRKPAYVNAYSTRNHAWLLIKNEQSANLFRHAPWWLPYEAAKLVASLFSPKQLGAEWNSLRGYATMLRKRKELKRRIVVSPQDMRKWFI